MRSLPIKLENDKPVISTLDIAIGLEAEHVTVFKLVRKFKNELSSIRIFDILNVTNSKKGRPVSYCFLNEEQSIFLVTLMRNSPKVVEFKKKLCLDFMKMRKQLLAIATRQQNAEWIEQRKSGKISRREETDIIKEFIQYATQQGSQNAKRYYVLLTNMQNKALFTSDQKYKNIRNTLSAAQLVVANTVDEIVKKALKDGMRENLFYKEIFTLAKKRVETFSELRGQTFVPEMEQIGYQATA